MDDEFRKEIILECVEIAENLIPTFKICVKGWSINFAGKQFFLIDRQDFEKFSEHTSGHNTIWFNKTVFYVNDYPKVYDNIRGLIGRGLSRNRKLIRNAFSDDYYKKFIHTIIYNVLNEGIELVRENPLHLDMFFDWNFHDKVIYVPLDGIEILIDSYKIGNVILTKLTQEKV